MVGNGEFGHAELENRRRRGEFGLDLEAAGTRRERCQKLRAEDAIAGEQVAGAGSDQEAERTPDEDVAEPANRRHRAGLRGRARGADGHVESIRQHRLQQRADVVGGIRAVAIDQNDGVTVSQRLEDRADGVSFALRGDIDNPDAQSGAAAPVPSVELLSKTTISTSGKAFRQAATTLATAATSL